MSKSVKTSRTCPNCKTKDGCFRETWKDRSEYTEICNKCGYKNELIDGKKNVINKPYAIFRIFQGKFVLMGPLVDKQEYESTIQAIETELKREGHQITSATLSRYNKKTNLFTHVTLYNQKDEKNHIN